MNIYKKLGNNKKVFELARAEEIPPESCGYLPRFFQLSGNQIEIRKDKMIEMKIKVDELNQILITPLTRQAIQKYKKNVSKKPNSINLISKQRSTENLEYVNFQLVLENTMLDLIAHNYMTFISFSEGIDELLKYKKNKSINEFLFHVHNSS